MNSTATNTGSTGSFGQLNSAPGRVERRQFADSRNSLDPEVRELAEAIDNYKMANNRRYITLAEVLQIIKSLGYHK